MTDRYDTVDELDEEATEAFRELIYRLADDEYVIAERDIEWQIYAPTLESDLALANIAQDEFGHARLWYDLAQETGLSEAACLWEKPADQWRHSTLVELPYTDGDWADPVLRSYLYDTAERLRVEALAGSSVAPVADRVQKILDEERYHREHAQSWLERLTLGGGADAGTEESHAKVQDALDRLFPHALTLFAAGEHEETIVAEGFRTETLDDLRREWLDVVIPYLESLDLTVPEPEDEKRTATGRNGDHTEHWEPLLEEFTKTYREFDFDHPVRLREGGVS
ncbi:1,2-phenylacetyl-CoA epoxidase subunit PaaC [Halolamina sp.]|jgi:ring-1,2-phenylacetyl-CoA epoxidase subunit PaaC|uniref:1,2-phenylacetyl-CoA epoxidase subunit PaaC n=1 Tax=Halolamina sp. TaxID=1940283 RepID=UPI000223BA58|nr:phenylacetate-CoA oxygenase, PaaI subunit [halophilic archaeon DL31]